MPAEGATKASNTTMSMSGAARARMREREKAVYNYYDDGGRPGLGNCTWGVGTLAHHGPCTADELKTKVGPAAVEAAFASRVAHAERIVRSSVTSQALTQAQFDALVSFVYNNGGRGSEKVLAHVDDGDLEAAARSISKTIHMTVRTETGTKKVIAHGLISRRAEKSAPFRPADK